MNGERLGVAAPQASAFVSHILMNDEKASGQKGTHPSMKLLQQVEEIRVDRFVVHQAGNGFESKGRLGPRLSPSIQR